MEGSLSLFFVSANSCTSIAHDTGRTSIFTPRAVHSRTLALSAINRMHELHSGTFSNDGATERNPVPESPTSRRRTHKMNTDVSPHRAVSAVRLLRIEQGGAFADLLSEKGRKATRNEMDYVERTLGFRTRDLEDRDVRLAVIQAGLLKDGLCSAQRADLRWNRRLEDLEQLKQLQDQLLDASSMLVKPGGILVYSTCSIDCTENEERVAAFLGRHPEFTVDPVHRFVPPEFVTVEGFCNTDPVKHSMDGSFAARLIRSVDNL